MKLIGTLPPRYKHERTTNADNNPSSHIQPKTTDTTDPHSRQPPEKYIATQPPNAAPSVKPHIMLVTAVASYFFGANSVVSAIVFGKAPPKPRPVSKRKRVTV